MSYRSNRRRRVASERKLRALRLLGWRYSLNRGAWVHRAFNGRHGPVYVDAAHDRSRIADELAIDAKAPRRVTDGLAGAALLPPLGHPLGADRCEPVPLPSRPRPLRLASDEPEVVRVKVRLSEDEEPRLVSVDGRPPRRQVDAPAPEAADDVEPIATARATS